MIYRGPIVGPPGWPAHEYEEALSLPDIRDENPAARKELCRRNPLIFNLLYFGDQWAAKYDGQVHVNDLHTDICRAGVAWARDDLGPGEVRRGWIAPRGAAKSTLLINCLPVWASCFRHRRFTAMFGSTRKSIAQTHFANLIYQLRTNELLRHDFPNFCTPAAGAGSLTSDQYVSHNGTIIAARGLDESNLGLNIRGRRPDCILIDDPEKDEGNFSLTKREKRLATLRQAILGMNPRAVVEWAGTTTAYGSLAHDLVRHAVGEHTADWIAETGFTVRNYPAVIDNPDGSRRSLWPVEFNLEWMLSQRGFRDFEMNFMNRPIGAGGTLWSQRHFLYGIPTSWNFSRLIMWIDPATTSNVKSDYTGIAVAGYADNVRKVGVLASANIKVSPEGLKRNVRQVLAHYYPQGLRRILVESNQGGEYVASALTGLDREFPHVKLELVHSPSTRGKAVEFDEAFGHYEREHVRHASQFRVAEDQMLTFPNGPHDDAGEAIVRCVNVLLAHLPTLARA